MCLLTKQIEWTKATRDVTCWKILYKMEILEEGKTIYITPYAHMEVSSNVLEGKEAFQPAYGDEKSLENKIQATRDFQKRRPDLLLIVDEGVIHTYFEDGNNLSMEHFIDAIACEIRFKADLIGMKMSNGDAPLILKSVSLWRCVIPSGTEYLKGWTSGEMSTLGAKAIVFKEKVAEMTEVSIPAKTIVEKITPAITGKTE